MRVLLKLLVVLGAILAAAWIGGEMLLARKAAALIAEDPQLEAAAVRELREPRRLGIRIEQPGFDTPEGGVALPWLDLWVPPQRPNEVHATLPPVAEAMLDGRPVALAAEGGALSLRFAPANGMALGAARIGAGSVTVDGQPVAEHVAVAARLVGLGFDAPRGAGTAYDLTADIAGLELAALTGGKVPGVASAAGSVRLWLDRAPARAGSTTPPRLVGLRADGLELRLDDLAARVWGRVVADAQGRAEGEVMIDTADAEGFIARAADLGLLPQTTVSLATAVLGGLAGGVAEAEAASASPPATPSRSAGKATAATVGASRPRRGATPPPLREGELRIPLGFRGGKAWLGPLPIGPAPRFPM